MKSWFPFPMTRLKSTQMHMIDLQRSTGTRDRFKISADDNDSDALLSNEVTIYDDQQPRWLRKPTYSFLKSRWLWTGLGVTLLVIILLLKTSSKSQILEQAYETIAHPDPAMASVDDRTFHIISMADHIDLATCRSILSAAVMQFPTMCMVDLTGTSDATADAQHPNSLGLDTILTWLQSLPSKHDKDIVLVLDASDTWFQLRPEILLQRYLDINDRANSQLREMYGEVYAAEVTGIRQDIVFTAQGTCPAELGDTLDCSPIPSSSEAPARRFLGSGIHIGSVEAMRELYKHAVLRAGRATQATTVQTLMTIIYVEQEKQRTVLLSAEGSRLSESNSTTEPIAGEFHIGLDHEGLLSFSPSTMNDVTLLRHGRGNASLVTRVFPDDILASRPPFWTVAGEGAAGMPDDTSWADMPLLTHSQSEVIPVLIHPRSTEGAEWWSKFWMGPHARNLMNEQLYQDMPAAIVVDPNTNTMQRYWASIFHKPGIQPLKNDYVKWIDSPCNLAGFAAHIFADGLGKWTDTYQ